MVNNKTLNSKPLNSNRFSIIVPVKKINKYILDEIIPALETQTYQNFELIIVPDNIDEDYQLPKWVNIIPSSPKNGPADKRDLGAAKSSGDILGFIDDDAYPDKKWLRIALKILRNNPKVAAVCGPGVTPEDDPSLAKVSGWVWSTWLGAGGAGTYRCLPKKALQVDDFPTFNLLIRKEDFNQVGGFDSDYWPGEDTKLCRDIVFKLKKEIIYHPKVKVYHHRRKIFGPHLKQVARYGRQRGFFAQILPSTSNRIGYWIPSLFTLGLIFGPLTYFIFQPMFYLYFAVIGIYLFLLLVSAVEVFIRSKNLLISLLVIPAIFATHLVYGVRFLQGYLIDFILSKHLF